MGRNVVPRAGGRDLQEAVHTAKVVGLAPPASPSTARRGSFFPPPPRLRPRERRELARQWLVRLQLPLEPKRIRQLSEVAGRYRPRSRLQRIADQIVLEGGMPNRKAVERRWNEYKKARAAEDRRRTEQYGLDRPATIAKIHDFIADTRTKTGNGPTWGELAAHMNWTRRGAPGLTRTLHRLGIIKIGDTARSIEVGDRPL